jgi:hypothetical protein
MTRHNRPVDNLPIDSAPALKSAPRLSRRDVVWPKEHGSWSLALEPLALGLLVAPSWPGVWLGLAVAAAFFARRPLKSAVLDPRPDRRLAAFGPLAVCIVGAVGCFGAALATGGTVWLPWLLPSSVAGAIFLRFDLRSAGREEAAEIAGASAFAFMPAAIAALAGWPASAALSLAVVMGGRAVPTVMLVRASLRAAKTGVRRFAPAIVGADIALVVGLVLARAGLAPRTAAGLLALLAVRAVALWRWSERGSVRARTLGIIEAVVGVGFVFATALAWRA